MRKAMIVLGILAIITAYFANGVMDGIAEQAQKDETRQAMDAVISEYGYGAVRIVSWSPPIKALKIRIREPLTLGTDSWCEAAGILFHKLASLDRDIILTVESEDGFVPSRMNPMTHEWTKILAQGY